MGKKIPCLFRLIASLCTSAGHPAVLTLNKCIRTVSKHHYEYPENRFHSIKNENLWRNQRLNSPWTWSQSGVHFHNSKKSSISQQNDLINNFEAFKSIQCQIWIIGKRNSSYGLTLSPTKQINVNIKCVWLEFEWWWCGAATRTTKMRKKSDQMCQLTRWRAAAGVPESLYTNLKKLLRKIFVFLSFISNSFLYTLRSPSHWFVDFESIMRWSSRYLSHYGLRNDELEIRWDLWQKWNGIVYQVKLIQKFELLLISLLF